MRSIEAKLIAWSLQVALDDLDGHPLAVVADAAGVGQKIDRAVVGVAVVEEGEPGVAEACELIDGEAEADDLAGEILVRVEAGDVGVGGGGGGLGLELEALGLAGVLDGQIEGDEAVGAGFGPGLQARGEVVDGGRREGRRGGLPARERRLAVKRARYFKGEFRSCHSPGCRPVSRACRRRGPALDCLGSGIAANGRQEVLSGTSLTSGASDRAGAGFVSSSRGVRWGWNAAGKWLESGLPFCWVGSGRGSGEQGLDLGAVGRRRGGRRSSGTSARRRRWRRRWRAAGRRLRRAPARRRRGRRRRRRGCRPPHRRAAAGARRSRWRGRASGSRRRRR